VLPLTLTGTSVLTSPRSTRERYREREKGEKGEKGTSELKVVKKKKKKKEKNANFFWLKNLKPSTQPEITSHVRETTKKELKENLKKFFRQGYL